MEVTLKNPKNPLTRPGARRLAIALIALAIGLPLSFSANAATFGPTPYSTPADSPFSGFDFSGGYFFLEDFDDHLVNTPGAASGPGGFASTEIPGMTGSLIDQVGLEGGCPPGGATIPCDTWFFAANFPARLSFTFNAAALGGTLPNAVGIVWTDGAFPGDAVVEAFDALIGGNSLGVINAPNIADDSRAGTTDEDRFFGITSDVGIARLEIGHSSGGLEVDHLQYGFGVAPAQNGRVPEPGSVALFGLGLVGLWLARRRTRAS
jgi:hypothetical protein